MAAYKIEQIAKNIPTGRYDGLTPVQERFLLHHQNARREENWRLKREFGITLKQKEAIIKEQGYECPICGVSLELLEPRFICVDHNHKTGEVRGVLCQPCNLAVGFIKENLNSIRKMGEYLTKNR
jgi:hypothetical protein